MKSPLEITITHNLKDADEVRLLLRQRLIALDWGRKESSDPEDYTGQARIQVQLFRTASIRGAAVLAAYSKAFAARPSTRMVGWIEPGASIEFVNKLICLRLDRAKLVDSSESFLGNLSPRSCTVQACHSRAKGRLLSVVRGEPSSRSVWSLHNRDVEVVVANYLTNVLGCNAIWTGGRSYAAVDHVGVLPDGREVLAQTTVSESLVKKKSCLLAKHGGVNRRLVFFGPASQCPECEPGIEYVAIEEAFRAIDQTDGGRWLINRMLA